MGGSAGQGQGRWNEVEHCLGTKALAISLLDGSLERELTTSRWICAECNEASREPMRTERRDDEVVSALSSMPLAYSLDHIPCPCPPGKSPRTPLVPHQLDGKPYWFTFNPMSHVLRLMCNCCYVPLSYVSVGQT